MKIRLIVGLAAVALGSSLAAVAVPVAGGEPSRSTQRANGSARPGVEIDAPRYASDTGRGPRFELSFSGENRGSGLEHVTLETRRDSNASLRWRRLRGATRQRTLTFPGKVGDTHSFRVRARDSDGNYSRYGFASTTVPLDDLSPRLRFFDGWRSRDLPSAYGGSLRRTNRAGASLRLRFTGQRVALIARRGPRAGRLRVRVEGRTRIVSLRGSRASRQVVYRSRELGPPVHRLTVTALGGGPVNIDAVAAEQGPQLPR